MATWFLINKVTIQPVVGQQETLQAGKYVDDSIINTAPITAAGGVLWPSADAVVAAAALVCSNGQTNKGLSDADTGAIMAAAASNSLLGGGGSGATKRQSLVLTLAGIQALTSGTAFDVGAALPANARLLGAEAVWTAITGGSLSAVSLVIGDATTANDVMTATDVWTASGSKEASAFQSRSGAQILAKLTATGDTLANATAGALTINLFFTVVA